MGEARKRGTAEQREKLAIKRDKLRLSTALGVREDDPVRIALKVGLKAFMDRLGEDKWKARRAAIQDSIRNRLKTNELENAQAIRVQKDEMGWYLFLCEQDIDDPFCTDASQSQRILPFFQSLGSRWMHAHKVVGIDRKLDEMLHGYKNNPDGLFFELLVALSYASNGWDVTFIEETRGKKTPDMRVTRGKQEFFVECKRLSRSTQYSEKERNQFLRLWDNAKDILIENGQWIWFKGTFHVPPEDLPDKFLSDLWKISLPIQRGVNTLIKNEFATIQARLIDQKSIAEHMREFRVKLNSAMLTKVIGGDWAPENSAVTMLQNVKVSHVAGCELVELGMYVDEVRFACGFTRDIDSEISLDKRAKDVTKLLSEAVSQMPIDKPSIVHLAAETMEGAEVERRRSEKIKDAIPDFIYGKPVALVRFHRLQSHQRAEMSFEFDETIDNFYLKKNEDFSHVPLSVVVPPDTIIRHGTHWDLYP
ncbi:hypothetical protein IGS61_01450 [Janthinobacterium sp. FW305-129]|uniref:hypothetical protein n=1 Tax=Janthinobacterium sp. FW305-129 TaxID=2775054 RepID=UPI001E56C337|nr:hypothetical protein [Janthinobacterium sp. FW305-129]MCC7596132.1 hypothetical protein [Janthinobacterium sp. FW305-129]